MSQPKHRFAGFDESEQIELLQFAPTELCKNTGINVYSIDYFLNRCCCVTIGMPQVTLKHRSLHHTPTTYKYLYLVLLTNT